MKRQVAFTVAIATVFTLVLSIAPAEVSAQSAGSWVDIARGKVGAGANANGMFQIAKNKASSRNGVDFGHGFALGAGPNGLAISNSIGVGGGNGGAAHNVQLNIGRGGAHLSHGGVVTQGGNRRVISGGGTGTNNGRVYGGSESIGFGQNTKAYSKSRTRQWGGQSYQSQPVYQTGGFSQPSSTRSSGTRGRVFRSGRRIFGR